MATLEVAKEAIWLRKFLMELGIIAKAIDPMILYCDNNGLLLKPKNRETIGKANTSKGSIT